MQEVKASIIIRCFNEEKHIGKLLTEISKQETDFDYEIILVDSGSNDGTVDIASNFDIRLIKIKPSDFTFGHSLNKGIEIAKGDFCLFISAHCYPVNKFWIQNLIKPFENPNTSIVYGKQQGYLQTKYSERQIFSSWFPEISQDKTDLAFCNNANCAIRKSDWQQRKYDETLTGLEDLDYAKYIFSRSKDIAYRADANVYHIHDETPKQIMNRYYREAIAYKVIYPTESFSFFNFLKFLLMNVMGDYIHATQDGVLLKNLISIPQFRFLQFYGTYKAHRTNKPISKEMQRRIFYPKKPKLFATKKKTKLEEGFKIIDISRPMTSTLAPWPGSKPFEIKQTKEIGEDGVHESELYFNIHSATHMDAPIHFKQDGCDISQVNLEQAVGEALVLECLDRTSIDVDYFVESRITKKTRRILLKTLNSTRIKDGKPFDRGFVAITSRAAKWLADNQFELIGIDGPSIQLFSDPNNATHEHLLGNNIIVLEGLDLTHAKAGTHKLIALPLKIPKAEGSPVRAILIEGNL